jgi:hypothetical protein
LGSKLRLKSDLFFNKQLIREFLRILKLLASSNAPRPAIQSAAEADESAGIESYETMP